MKPGVWALPVLAGEELDARLGLTPDAVFEGREQELSQLHDALERTDRGELSIVVLEGESGMGKSTLVAEFVRRQLAYKPETWVLYGRCHPHDGRAYAAFEGCVELLARVLVPMPEAERASFLPSGSAALAQLFPAFARIRAAAPGKHARRTAEPTARRLEAFATFSTLLSRLAEDRPLVVVLEDVHWADPDSLRLLRAVIDGEPPILLVCTTLPRAELAPELSSALDALRDSARTRCLGLRGLSRSETQHLAAQLLGGSAHSSRLRSIAVESRGHPAFVAELVHDASSHDAGTSGSPTLDALLETRIAALPGDARHVLELLAVVARPCPERWLAHTLERSALDSAIELLEARRLVRRRDKFELACESERVRVVVDRSIERDARARLHGTIARALIQDPMRDASEEARHWDASGEHERALVAYERAAVQALSRLAFARADQLTARALTLCDPRDANRVRALTLQRARALTSVGRGAEAARLFQAAAARSGGDARIRLEVLAAQSLIQSAHVDEGMASARKILHELGVTFASGSTGALARIAWNRAWLALQRPPSAPRAHLDAREALVLDAVHALSLPLSWVDVLSSAALSTEYVRRAIAANEPRHLALATAQEGLFRLLLRGDTNAAQTDLSRARMLAESSDVPELAAHQSFVEGAAALLRLDFASARRLLVEARAMLEAHAPDASWLLTHVRTGLCIAHFMLGDHRALAHDTERWMREARERDDRFALAALAGAGSAVVRHLMADAPDRAEAELVDAMRPWPTASFGVAHAGELIAGSSIQLYRGGDTARTWLMSRESTRDSLVALEADLVSAWFGGCRAAAVVAAIASTDPAHHKPLLRDAAEARSALSRRQASLASATRDLLDAQLAVVASNVGGATLHATAAASAFERLGMKAHAQAARHLLGSLERGPGGRRKREAALAYFREQGWKDPVRALSLYVPVLRVLERNAATAAEREPVLLGGRYQPLDQAIEAADERGVAARDVRSGRLVELEPLARATPDALARFKQEFRVMQGVAHPSLVRLEALFEHEGRWFVARQPVEGRDLLSAVCDEHGFVEARVRAVFSELLCALAVLHEAGFAHRDVTPKSVRVTDQGRLVLLELGLAASLSEVLEGESASGMGTTHYMAPEQIEGGEVHVAADVYAVGVCLYQALTGMLPYDAPTPDGLLLAKQRGRPVPPAIYEPSVPADLDALCMAMLERDPERRPSVRATLATLAGERFTHTSDRRRPSPTPTAHPATRTTDEVFAGRQRELLALAESFARTRKGTPALVLIEGESGIGKTTLITELLRSIQEEHSRVLVLHSRCFENEQIAYKAFDAAMDELARALRRRPADECRKLLPPKAPLLAQLFPVLGSVGAIAAAPRKGIAAEPAARRLQAFEALRALWSRVADEQPVVLAIDDLQWADRESFRLLRALLDGPAAPPLFFVATVRSRDEHDDFAAAQLEGLRALETTETLVLGSLAEAEAERLARSLLGPVASPRWLELIVRESRGHPLFLRELALHARDVPEGADTASLSLDDALRTRLRALAPAARHLFELIAISGRPCAVSALERALGDATQMSEASDALLAKKLVRWRRTGELVAYHDRLRQVVLAAISEERKRELARALARALDVEEQSEGADRARLWELAGEPELARRAYEAAAHAALDTLQFGHAEGLYARAIALVPEDDRELVSKLSLMRGKALSCAGRSAEAVEAYAVAARHAATEETRLSLRVLEAQHRIQAGEIHAGLEAARMALEALGVPLPASSLSRLARIVLDRTLLAAQRLDIAPRDAREVDPADKRALDALHTLAFPVTWTDLLGGVVLTSSHLRRALSSREPAHLARALAQEAMFRVMQRPADRREVDALLARSHALAAQLGAPAVRAQVELLSGMAALFRWDLAEAKTDLEAALERVQTQCPDEPWLLTNVRTSVAGLRIATGEYSAFSAEMNAWVQEARARQDRFALGALVTAGVGFLRHLMVDAPERALDEARIAMEPWSAASLGYPHLGEIAAMANIASYRGSREGWDWFGAQEPRMRGAFLFKTRFGREWYATYSAFSALTARRHVEASERPRLDRHVARSARTLAALRVPRASAVAHQLEAQLAALAGRQNEARRHARAAREGFAAIGFMPYVHTASYLEGFLLGGDEGRALRVGALSALRAQGWVRPDRYMRLSAPALDMLE